MIRRHLRFLAAFLVGLCSAAGAWAAGAQPGLAALVGVDAYYVVYLCLMLPLVRQTPEELQRRAAEEDEGAGLIILLSALAVGAGLTAILTMLIDAQAHSVLQAVLALASVPLGWAMVHTMAAFHYANLFYGHAEGAEQQRGGFDFPGPDDPDMWDFLYVSFGIGMTAQVADVNVMQPLRKPVLLHCIVSFFLNTVTLALAVNAAVGLSS